MWMFGSRTTVKKVRNSLTWFSQMLTIFHTKSDKEAEAHSEVDALGG